MAPRRTAATCIFLFSILCVAIVKPANGQIVSLPGVKGIVIYEATGNITPYFFSIKPTYDTRLNSPNVEPIGPNNCDICTDAGEFYDVFISDATGKQNKTGGKFITIKYNRQPTGATNFGVGGNIDAIGIVFDDGKPTLWASFVNRVRNGKGLTLPQFVNTHGFARNALGAPDGTITYLGDSEAQLQVGFPMPEGSSLAMLLCGVVPLGLLAIKRTRKS